MDAESTQVRLTRPERAYDIAQVVPPIGVHVNASGRRAGLGIAERLAADPSNAGWQRDLLVSLTKLGFGREQQGKQADAAGSYAKAHAIVKRLTALDPTNAQWRNDLAWVEGRLEGLRASTHAEQ